MNHAAVAIAAAPALLPHAFACRLAALLSQAGLDELAAAASAETARLTSGVLTVAIVGEFKRGKSTLINALLGVDLLPVGALPLTAVGTRVEPGDTVQVVVELLDGQHLRIDPAAVVDYATERGNPGNQRQVAVVTIAAPAPVLRAPLHLLDTPGIGSAFADVSATARTLLDQADAAVVVLSAEQPASRRELDFLREVLATDLPTFIVENKIDLVPSAEQDEVLNFVSEQVGNLRSGAGMRLFALSADQARRAQRAADPTALAMSRVPALEAALLEFAQREGRTALAAAVRRRLIRIIDRAIATLDLRQRVDPLRHSWHDQRQVQLRGHANVVLFRDLLDAQERVAVAAEEIEYRLLRLATEAAGAQRLQAILDGGMASAGNDRPLRRSAADREAHLRRALDQVINQWSDAERHMLSAVAAEITARWPARVATVLSPIVGTLSG